MNHTEEAEANAGTGMPMKISSENRGDECDTGSNGEHTETERRNLTANPRKALIAASG